MNLRFFPSRRLAIYMAKLFIVRSFAVLAMLVLVLQSLDMLGESGDILAAKGNTQADLWFYVSMRAPEIIARFLPFSVLLGTLITLSQLNQNSEVVAMKAAGLSAHQILAPLVLASVAVAGISFAFNDRVVAPATAYLSVWKGNDYVKVPADTGARINMWVRDGDDLVRAGTVSGKGDGLKLTDVDIFVRRNDMLVGVLHGATARRAPEGKGWLLEDATRFDVATAREVKVASVPFGQGVLPESFQLTSVNPDGLSFLDLNSAIDELDAAGKRTVELKANLWHKLSGPLSSLLMPLLGSIAAFGLARSGQLFVRAVIGMALGFAYFVADNFALAMGGLGAYDPLIAAWGPFLLFLLIGETVLVRTEE